MDPLINVTDALATAAPASSVSRPATAADVTPCAHATPIDGSSVMALHTHANHTNRFMVTASGAQPNDGRLGRVKNARR